jgi:hypothetical protein
MAAFLRATAGHPLDRFALSERRGGPAVEISRSTTRAGLSDKTGRGSAAGTALSNEATGTTIDSARGKRQVTIGGVAVRMTIVARPTAADRHTSTRQRGFRLASTR